MPVIDGPGPVAIKVPDVERSMDVSTRILSFLDIGTDRAPGLDANGGHHVCLTAGTLEPLSDHICEAAGLRR